MTAEGFRSRDRRPSLTRRAMMKASAAGLLAQAMPVGLGAAFAQNKPVKIGVLAPLSGVYASLGTNKVNGIRMFFEEQGMKIGDRPVELIVEDDEAKPQEGLRKARKLIEQDEADVLLGVISSAIGLALKDYVARAKRVWVTTGAAADGIFKKKNKNPYAFRASLSVWQANNPLGTWLSDKNYDRYYVAGPDYAMGREAVDAFRVPFEVNKAKKVGEAFVPLGTSDFAAYLADIKKAEPNLVYASFAGSDAVRFVQQYAGFGLKEKIKLAGYGYLVSDDVLEAQGDAALGILSGHNWASGLDTPANQRFMAEYRRRYANAAPTVDSVAGYVGAQIVAEAVKSLGGSIGSQEALGEAILKVKIYTPRGPVSFDPETHNVVQNIYVLEVVRDGPELKNKVLATYENVRDPGV